jgi:hypothetical protein
MASEAEWSQHKKLIDFSTRPGGFRRAMVPHLPYFMVQWDYKGEKGYGHVIEGVGDSAGGGEGDGAVDEGDKGGGEFPRLVTTRLLHGEWLRRVFLISAPFLFCTADISPLKSLVTSWTLSRAGGEDRGGWISI